MIQKSDWELYSEVGTWAMDIYKYLAAWQANTSFKYGQIPKNEV